VVDELFAGAVIVITGGVVSTGGPVGPVGSPVGPVGPVHPVTLNELDAEPLVPL
jgi:hypothetical protein